MYDFSCISLEHDIGRMSIAQSQYIADYGHSGQTAGVVVPGFDPGLAIGRLKP
jgi:hypothetical protein